MGKPHDAETRAAISATLRHNAACRTPEQVAATNQKISDAKINTLWIPKGGLHYGRKPGATNKMDSNTPVGGTTLAKIEKASIKKIIRELASTEPGLFRDAMIAGLEAPPPRSFPYLALAAAYCDGKPVDAGTHQEMTARNPTDLTALSSGELREYALRIVRKLDSESSALAVIDATVIRDPEDMTPEQLQEEIRLAQIEVDRANEELRRVTRNK